MGATDSSSSHDHPEVPVYRWDTWDISIRWKRGPKNSV